MNPYVMTVLLVSMFGFFLWTAARRLAVLIAAKPEPRFTIEGDALATRIKDTVVYALGQYKMPYYRAAGLAHIAIFFGFVVLTLNTAMLWGRGYDPEFTFFGLFALDNPIGVGYNLLKEAFLVLVLVGCAVFFYYRIVVKAKRMTLGVEGLIILGIISVMMISDMLYGGATLVLHGHASAQGVQFHGAEPVASIWGFALAGLGPRTLTVLQHMGFWTHATLPLNLPEFESRFAGRGRSGTCRP